MDGCITTSKFEGLFSVGILIVREKGNDLFDAFVIFGEGI